MTSHLHTTEPLWAPAADPDFDSVQGARAGDITAFEELAARYRRRIFKTLSSILDHADDVEDAVQDTMMQAFQHIGEFQGRSRFSTWLQRIAINTGLQRLRERKRRALRERDGGLWLVDFGRTAAPDPEQCCSQSETHHLIQRALQRLPLKYRHVVLLGYMNEMSNSEIASALGVELSTAKTWLHRGRRRLKQALAPAMRSRTCSVPPNAATPV